MKSLFFIVILFGCIPCLAQGSPSCGETSQSGTDSGNALWGLATPCTTGSNAGGYTVSSISYWVGSATSTSFDLGVYNNASPSPSALLCSVSTGTITPSSGWNSINVSGCPTLSASTQYWIGYVTGSNQVTQGTVTGSCPGTSAESNWTTAAISGISLPSTFPANAAGSACYSLYLTVNPVSSTNVCGETSQSGTDSGNALWGLATPCTTGSNAGGYTVSSISYWVGSATSTSFDLGVYNNASPSPSALLCSVSTGTITPSSGWNSINVSGCPTLSASTQYWIGYVTGSNQVTQGTVTGSCPGTSAESNWTTAAISGISLPSTFPANAAGSACYSLYLTVNPVSSTNVCGETSQSGTDSGNALWGLATPCTTGSNAGGYTVSSISYWVGSATSTSFDLGVYNNASPSPSALLCSVSTGTITPSSGWNSINVSGCPTLSASTQYWIGYVTGSNQVTQGTVTGSCPGTSAESNWTTAAISGISLPSTFPANAAGSACYSLYLTVNPVPSGPTLTLSSSHSPSATNEPVTFTATISDTTGGTVNFYDGSTLIGTASITGTSAALTTSTLAAGYHSVTASLSSLTSQILAQEVGLTGFSNNVVYGYVAGYDAVGNITAISDSVMGDSGFGYDTLNRLIQGSYHEIGSQWCWSYDAFGNKTAEESIVNGCPTSSLYPTASYNANNEVTWTTVNSASSGFTYDAAGNVINDNVNWYLYDAEGRICAVKAEPIQGTYTMTGYLYDAEGNRVEKGTIGTWGSCNPNSNGFVPTNEYVIGLSGEQETEMTRTNNVVAWQHTNVWAGSTLIATYDNGGLHFYLNDPLGSRRAQTNNAGVLEQTCGSLPFGDDLSCNPSGSYAASLQVPTEHHFTGKERDTESGNDYFGARYYASTMGRFMSPDPSQLYFADPTNPQSLNLYSYGWNNPLTNIDPTGLDCVKDNGDGTATTNVGDCANENEAAANAEHYINCDGCTSGATGAQLDTATGSLYLTTTDANGNTSGIAGTTVSDWASPQGLSTNVNVSGGTSGDVSMSGYGVGLLAYFPYANLSLPPATIRDPNAPPALPKLKGKDKRLCLWGQMTNEMLGGEGGPSDSSDTAPGRGGAAAIPFHTTTRGGKPVTRQMGVSESGDSTMGGVQTLWDYGWAVAACLAN